MTLYALYATVLIGAPLAWEREPLMTGMRLEACKALSYIMVEQARAENINIIITCQVEKPNVESNRSPGQDRRSLGHDRRS